MKDELYPIPEFMITHNKELKKARDDTKRIREGYINMVKADLYTCPWPKKLGGAKA